MAPPDILIALNPVVKAFEHLSIPYYIGGSVASSIYGLARSTLDVDIIADIRRHHVPTLGKKWDKEYYFDKEMAYEAISHASSFNIIHYETTLKIDIFIYKDEPYQKNAIKRRVKDRLDDQEDFEYFFSSPEDIIIAKLQWFELGGRVSERQWLDIIGVVKVRGKNLDFNYLNSWARKLGLFSLFEKVLDEAGIENR